jgi:hypothetical protein
MNTVVNTVLSSGHQQGLPKVRDLLIAPGELHARGTKELAVLDISKPWVARRSDSPRRWRTCDYSVEQVAAASSQRTRFRYTETSGVGDDGGLLGGTARE